jgi:uncharacterized protein YndB with AHSA1/START domain
MPIVEDRVEHEIFIDAAPADVFGYFTDPVLMVRWMGREAKLDARPGGGYRVEINDLTTAVGEYVAVEPPNRVVLTWGWLGSETVPPGASTVEVTLTPADGGTRVRLVHRHLPAAGEERAKHEHGWSHFMSRLAVVGSGGDPGPDPMAASTAG